MTGQQRDRVGADLDALLLGDAADHGRELLGRGAGEVEAVAAVDDRRQHLAGLGRGQDEDRVRRRLLEGLQERVPRLRREHVRLVEDVDLRAPADRRELDGVAQLADVVDRVVRRRVHLDDVERRRARDRHAGVADAARLGRRARPRSSGRRRGSSPSRSCRCPASPRTGRRGGPSPARWRCAGCGRHAPGPRRRRTSGAGGGGTARGRRTREVESSPAAGRSCPSLPRHGRRAPGRPHRLAADPLDLDGRRRPRRPRPGRRVGRREGPRRRRDGRPRAPRRPRAARRRGAAVGPRGRPDGAHLRPLRRPGRRRPGALELAPVRARGPRRPRLRPRRRRRQGQLLAAAARRLRARPRRRAARPRPGARRGRGGGRGPSPPSTGCAPTRAAPTRRSSTTAAWPTRGRRRSRPACAASSCAT